MVGYYAMADGEPQTGSLAGGFGGEEGVDHLVDDLGRNPDSCIIKTEINDSLIIQVFESGGNDHFLFGGGSGIFLIQGVASIIDYIYKNLHQLLKIGKNRRQSFRNVYLKVNAVLQNLSIYQGKGLANHLINLHQRLLPVTFPGE